MNTRRGQRARQLMVWLHVLASVGWMAQAVTATSLLALGLAGMDRQTGTAALDMAVRLDETLMAPVANAAAFTGLTLAATTAWGYFRHWWVLAKFSITMVQLYVGIFVFSTGLTDSAADIRVGAAPAVPSLLVGSVLMAGAIATQAWFSIRKPWPRTPWSGQVKPPTAPGWVFVLAIAATVVDLVIAELVGYPVPAASIIALVVALVVRRRAKRAGADAVHSSWQRRRGPDRAAGQLAG